MVREMSYQLFVTLYTLYIYPSAHKQLRWHLPSPFCDNYREDKLYLVYILFFKDMYNYISIFTTFQKKITNLCCICEISFTTLTWKAQFSSRNVVRHLSHVLTEFKKVFWWTKCFYGRDKEDERIMGKEKDRKGLLRS